MRTFSYLLRESWVNMWTNRTTTMVAILTTTFTLACVGVFLLVYVNLRAAAGWLQDDIKIMVYLDERLTSDSVAEVERQLRGDRAVASLLFISKEQALGEFKAQFPSESHLLEGLGQNPLPASFVVALSPFFRSPDVVKRWAERVRQVSGVSKVDYNQDWIDALATVIRSIELVAIGIGVILSAAAVTIIANTIRLTLFARRDEIAILRLIGATTSFIRIPYLLEGAALGALGSTLSLVMLKVMYELFRQQMRTTGRFSGIENFMAFFPRQSVLPWLRWGWGLGLPAVSYRYGVSARSRREVLEGAQDRNHDLGAAGFPLADSCGRRSNHRQN